MAGSKKPDFLSLLSKNGLNALKQKLVKNKNEPCPINTINQLLQTPLAVPKQGNSLRSLRSKPCRPPQPAPPPNTTITNDDAGPVLTSSINVVNRINEGETDVLQNETNQASNTSVFAVPTMRAPRSIKNETSYWVDENFKAASLAWLVLDKKYAEQLICILSLHLLNVIEDCAPGTSEIQNPCPGNDVFQFITSWLNNQVSGCMEQFGDSDYPEMDNMTSVSGYPPFQSAFGNLNPRVRDYRAMVNDRMAGYDRVYDQSVVGSVYEDNPYGYGVGRNSTMQGGGAMSNFMKANGGGSVAGSFYHQRNDPFMNQSIGRPPMHVPGGSGRMLPSFMNSTASVIGSVYHQRNDPYMNQTSFMFKPPMGYPHAPMSVRSDASYAHKPLRSYSQMNQTGLLKENPRMSQNMANMRRVPSVVNYGEDEENIYDSHERENLEQPRRKMHTPLEPVVVLERIDCDMSIAEEKSNQADSTARSTRVTSSYTMRNLNNSRNITNLKQANSLRNDTTIKNQARQNRQVGRTVVSTPLKEVNMNESSVLRVTRSGRAVRAPQTFWASEMSALPSYNHTVQVQGIKRKRNYRD